MRYSMMAACALACLIALSPAFAQSIAGGGTIQGTVTDSSGAAVPGAQVQVRHLESGVVTRTVSNQEGFFSTPSLKIGSYRVRVESPGMKAWEGELSIETGRTAAVSAALHPGAVSETVTISDAAPLVTTTDPTDGGTLDNRRISELPINGRDLNTLLPDVTPGVEQVIDARDGGVRTGGLMTYSTTYTQDGAPANNREFGGSANLQGLDSVGEVRIETSTSSARYNTPGSVVVTTKSGGNRIRGSLYEIVRNNAFGVARARQDVLYDGQQYRAPKLIRNEFGGTIGGPVVLPSFGLNGKRFYNGRNRTFFFLSREGQEVRQGITRTYTSPTAAMRSGDFSGLVDSQGRKLTLYDPLTTTRATAANGRTIASRLPFIDNRIPISRESPLAKFVWGITRMPTDSVNPLVADNLKVVVPSVNISDTPTTLRLDHRISDRDTFFLKFNGGRRGMAQPPANSTAGAPTANDEANVPYFSLEALAGAWNWTHVFTPSLFMETLVTRSSQTSKTVWGPVQKNWAAELGLPNPMNEIGWPSIFSVGFDSYLEENRRSLRSLTSHFEQNLTHIRGTHNIQFGWRYRQENQTLLPDQGNISGTAYFNSYATAVESSSSGSAASPAVQTLSGHDSANFFLGIAAQYQVGLKRGLMRLTDRNAGLYLQDSYKVTNRLTLTAGVRWDINPAFAESRGLINAFDMPSHSIVLPRPLEDYYRMGVTSPAVVNVYQAVDVKFRSAEELGMSPRIFQSNNFDIGPRAGFAYRAFEGRRQFVIRGGYGLYISPIPMRSLLASFSSMPPFRATYSYNPNSAAQSPDGISNYLLRTVPTIFAGVNSANAVDLGNPIAVGRGIGVFGMGALPSMQVHEWNLALERQLGANTVLRLRYNGKHAVHADQLRNINPSKTAYVWYMTTGEVLPTGTYANVARRPYDSTAYTDVQILQKTGYMNASVFAIELERRFSRGLGFQLFHTMTNAFRLAGNANRDGLGSVPDGYLPGTVPTDPEAFNRFLLYQRDTGVPKHRTRWNWNYELPFGRGKRFAPNATKWLDAAIGGWKFSGAGTVVSSWFSLPVDQWGTAGKFEVYGRKYPILDCRATPTTARSSEEERCFEGYLYFNGYISQRYLDSRNAYGMRNGVFGLPADYAPAREPVNPWPKGGKPGDAGSGDWDTSYVYIKLKNGTTVREIPNNGLHPWRNQYRLGPFNWTTDASLMKFFRLREGVRLRASFDVFNVLNEQGLNPPGTDGVVTLQNSYSGFGMRPRQVQVGARLEW